MERRATTAKKALELAEQKANELLSKLGKAKLKLTKTTNIFSTWDKEFANLKVGEKAWKQIYYNRGFKDAKNLVGPVVFQTWKFEFMEGWIAAVNAIQFTESCCPKALWWKLRLKRRARTAVTRRKA